MSTVESTEKIDQSPDRRHQPRSTELSNPMAEIQFPESPMYVLKVKDLSEKGAGIVVRPDSSFLKLIEIGEELIVRLILPIGFKGPSVPRTSRVEHITEIREGPFHGHLIVGLSFFNNGTQD